MTIVESWLTSEQLRRLHDLKTFATKYGCFIKVRPTIESHQDFCIYVYNKSVKEHGYLVGFDGCMKPYSPQTSFEGCVAAAAEFINSQFANRK